MVPFLALHLSVQQVIFVTHISEHFLGYLSLQLFHEAEQFNYSHFSVVEMRNRELNDLPKVVQEVCGRERLCPGAFLQDVIETQLQILDILIHKTTAAAPGDGVLPRLPQLQASVICGGRVQVYFALEKTKILKKEVETATSPKHCANCVGRDVKYIT